MLVALACPAAMIRTGRQSGKAGPANGNEPRRKDPDKGADAKQNDVFELAAIAHRTRRMMYLAAPCGARQYLSDKFPGPPGGRCEDRGSCEPDGEKGGSPRPFTYSGVSGACVEAVGL